MTMFCPDEERLSAWIDRALTPAEDETISTHLATCEECRRSVTIAFLANRESPEAISEDGERNAFMTVQGALSEPTRCVSDEQLAAWLHDGLAPVDRAVVTDHLAECDDCRRVAALTRLSNSEPVSALEDKQESRALKVVLRSAGRDAFFSVWRVAAASILVAVAATYIAIQWSGTPEANPATAATVVNPPAGSNQNSKSEPKGIVAMVNPPTPDKVEPVPSTTPEKAAPTTSQPPIPARYQPLLVYETEGTGIPSHGRISYGDVLKPQGVASINVEGRALVVLDEGSEARLAYATDSGAYVVEIAKGRVYVDTAGSKQKWEIRRKDRSVTLWSLTGRAVATVETGLHVDVLRGEAEVGSDRVGAGRGVDVREDSSVAIEDRGARCELQAKRYGEMRLSRTLLVLRAAPGETCNEGPWSYSSPSKDAQPLETAALVPECPDPIRWVVIDLDEPLKFASDMQLRASCGGTGSRVQLWVGGAGGWHGETKRSAAGKGPEQWPLRGLRRDMVDIVAGEEIRRIMIGVVQERGEEFTLEVERIEIRRVLE